MPRLLTSGESASGDGGKGGGGGAGGVGRSSGGGGGQRLPPQQLASAIQTATSTSDLLDLYACNMYSLDARHVVALWPRLAKRVSAECGRNDLRIASWVADHRGVISQLLAHCLRVSFDAPQRDVAQVEHRSHL